MGLPSKKQQVEAVMRFLDADENEGKDLVEIATSIVEGYLDALLPQAPLNPMRQGMLIKSPVDAKVRRVAYLDDAEGVVWVVGETASFGWLGSLDEDLWDYCEEFRPKRRIQIDGKGKMVEMTDEEIAEAWSNPDHNVGDQVSQRQRQYVFEVIATGPQCVLLRNLKTGRLTVDSNTNLGKYYKREVRGAAEW